MITKADVVAKFKELHKASYNSQGYMISNVPDEITETVFVDAVWRETYNRHASEHVRIRSLSMTVPLLGRDFKMQFDRPLVKDHHCEFEEYFGFGGTCKDFTLNRTIARFPSKFDADLNIDELLSHDDAGPIDADYAKKAIMLLALGGYVKYWNAVYDFQQWFTDVAGIPECMGFAESKGLLTRIFEVMAVEPPTTPPT